MSRNPFKNNLQQLYNFAVVVLSFLCIYTTKKSDLGSLLDHIASKDYCL